jgi:hypothetical protein
MKRLSRRTFWRTIGAISATEVESIWKLRAESPTLNERQDDVLVSEAIRLRHADDAADKGFVALNDLTSADHRG